MRGIPSSTRARSRAGRYRARHLANEHEPLSENAASHHQSIVDKLLAGDGDAAERAMRDHLLDVSAIIAPAAHKLSDARG